MKAEPSIRAAHDEAAARLYERVRAAVAATPAAGTRTARRISIAVCAACAATVLIVIGASQLVYGQWAAGLSIAVQSQASVLTVAALVLSLASITTLSAVWRGRGGFGLPVVVLAALALLVTPLYAAFTVLLTQHVPSGEVIVSWWGARCLMIAALVGSTVLALFAWAMRRASPETTVGRAAALGACAGAWAGAAVFFFCPSADHQHLLIGHVLPIAVLTVVGVLLLPKALRP